MLRNLVRAQLLAPFTRASKGAGKSTKDASWCIRRGFSSQSQPTQLLESDFSLGQSLNVQLRSPTAVRIKHGSPYLLHAEWTGPGPADRFEVVEEVQEREDSSSKAELAARIPERYCGLRVNAAGGDISVPGTSEAWLEASTTTSGCISIGKCKGHSVSVATEDGDISGSITALDIVVKTRSGQIDLKRVAGARARVSMSNGGSHCCMNLGVLQCGSADIDSGGSDINIKQIAVAPDTKEPEGSSSSGMQIRSGTGSITVSGVDGPAKLESRNSQTHLQVLQNTDFQAVNHGGVINVQLEPAKQYKIHACASQGVWFGEGCVAEGETDEAPPEFDGWIVCEGEGQQQTEARCLGSSKSACQEPTLRLSADRVNIQRKSWRRSLQERLLKKISASSTHS